MTTNAITYLAYELIDFYFVPNEMAQPCIEIHVRNN